MRSTCMRILARMVVVWRLALKGIIAALLATVLLLLASADARAQSSTALTGPTAPHCVVVLEFTATGTTSAFDNRPTACTTWHLTYQSSGFTALSLQFEAASDSFGSPGTFAAWPTLASGASLPLTSTTEGQATGYKYKPWIRVNLSSVTGSGVVKGQLVGYRAGASQDSSAAPLVTDTSGRLRIDTTDPCASPSVTKSNVSVAITANSELVALTSGQTIYVCSYNLVLTGTTPTVQFVYGTGAVCVTGQVALSGAMNPTAGSLLSSGFGGTLFPTAASNALCALVTGTSPVVRGHATIVKQ